MHRRESEDRTRLHGSMSLELGGHLKATSIDPALLYRDEVDDLIG